jgi:ferrous iron transport protein A
MEFNAAPSAAQASIEAEFWNITFIGGSAGLEEEIAEPPRSTTSPGARLPLAMTVTGDRVWVVEIKGGHRMVRRLTDLGIAQGREITIVSRTESGSVIVGLEGCRIGLGAGMAHRVIVTTVEQETQSTPPLSPPVPSISGDPTMSSTPLPPIHLGTLSVGQSGRIVGYEKGPRGYREKLLSMGLTPGTLVTVTRQAPLGDPLEIEVRGFKLSLRKEEAATLKVEAVGRE